ncbi:MAG TPA: HAMP domain-containing sensor histidine kinase, partial [Anaeromyxobacter sp.]|nr:HAMP domain-containing sensor histidine kinase [Anaeromyxobacter sp.]
RMLREAQLAAQAREDFLHVASHELRGPLGTLRLGVQLLARDVRAGNEARLEARLGLVERQAERLSRLSDMLLDVSRITSGRLELFREDVDLAALSAEAAGRLAGEAAEAGCVLSVKAPSPVRARIDPGRLDQVLVNLLSNALKYGRGGPVELRVEGRGDRAVISVKDRGIGIAQEDQERIFGRFERAVSGRNYSGLGLGLWIVRRIVEAHGGTIGVSSAPGEGSTFTVELPLGPVGAGRTPAP